MENEGKNRETASFFRDRWVLLASVVAVLALAGMIVTTVVTVRKGPKRAPDFVLRDQQGRLTSLRQFRGKVVVLTFIDPHCTTICPLTTESMVDALRLLGPAASRVQLLGIDANPQATRVADVAAYTRAHEMQGRWRFLTGSLAQLKRVWSRYHVYVAAIHNNIDHEAITFVISPHGRVRAAYSTLMSYEGVAGQAQLLAKTISRVLPGRPAVGRETAATNLPPLDPAATVRLTALGPQAKSVTVGAAHPHLLLFFAGWLREDANLPARLAALDRYAAAARRRGWPSPVAIDEVTTEPSAKAAHKLLTQLAAKLRAPIIEDRQGRLADGYGVQDLPWFVLDSRSGRILWHHDGWLSAAALRRQVRAALAEN
jgi:cytochrome oxidase Cu insertion factor (SCO1/SenC/PrrC family)